MSKMQRVASFGGTPFKGAIYQTQELTNANDRIPEEVVVRQLSYTLAQLEIDHEIRYGFNPVSIPTQNAGCTTNNAVTADCDTCDFDVPYVSDPPDVATTVDVTALNHFADYLGKGVFENQDAPHVAPDSNLLLTNAGGGGCAGVGGNAGTMGANNIDRDPFRVVEWEDSDWASNVHGAIHEVGHNLSFSHADHGGWAENRANGWHKTPTVASNGKENRCGEWIPTRTKDNTVPHLYYHDCVGETAELVDKNELAQQPIDAGFTFTANGLTVSVDGSPSVGGGGIRRHVWEFGDGTTREGQYVTHTYDDAGSYEITLTVTGFTGNKSSASQQVSVDGLEPMEPRAEAQASTDGMTATFDGRNTRGGADIVEYRWSTGDGGNATGQLVDWTYTAAGSYNVTLEVEDELGRTDTDTTTVSVSGQGGGGGLVAGFGATVGKGREVVFDASNTAAPDGVDRYQWAFGDGGTATGRTVSYAYESDGDYDVTLTVTGSGGAVDSKTVTVPVTSDDDTREGVNLSRNQKLALGALAVGAASQLF